MIDWNQWTVDTFKPDGLGLDAVTNSLDVVIQALAAWQTPPQQLQPVRLLLLPAVVIMAMATVIS